MQFLKKKIEQIRPLFAKGGKYEKLHYVYEATETVIFQPKTVAGNKGAHIRDAVDMKRLMFTVIVALVPCMLFGMYNIGYQHFVNSGVENPVFWDSFLFGAMRFVPILMVSYIVGLGIEFVWATIFKHPVAEGFLVSGILIPLIMPSTIPLWQVGVATAFAVIIGKEVFGGVGMNIVNPALTARAFLFFAYPMQISGDKVWVDVDGFAGATILGEAAMGLYNGPHSFMDMFLGFIPGSIGETSVLMCIIGAVILLATGVASGRIMFSMLAGGAFMAWLVEYMGANYFGVNNFYYHLVVGGFAFGLVFMATDPVSAAQTNVGKLIYGFLAGLFSILVRVVNPAYPEGVMLAILLMNVFAPLIDYFVVEANKQRRLKRATV